MTGGAPYLTPYDAAKINRRNVPPPAEQPPQLRVGLPPAKPMTNSPHPAHAVVNHILASGKAAGTSSAHTGAGQRRGLPDRSLDPMAMLTGMVTALLKGGSPNQLLDPNSLSDAAAAPSTALGSSSSRLSTVCRTRRRRPSRTSPTGSVRSAPRRRPPRRRTARWRTALLPR